MRSDVRQTARIRIAGRPSPGDTRRGREYRQASDADRGDFSQHRGRGLNSGGIFTEAEATTKHTKHTEGAHSAPSLRFAAIFLKVYSPSRSGPSRREQFPYHKPLR